MEANTDIDEKAAMALYMLRFVRRDQPQFFKDLPVIANVSCLGQPHDGLQIAQSARALLDIGLQIQRDIMVACMAAPLFVDLAFKKCLYRQRLKKALGIILFAYIRLISSNLCTVRCS